MVRLRIVYDKPSLDPALTADFGFACVVDAHGRRLLFDTGAHGDILLHNLTRVGIALDSVDAVFISHDHWDHQGGLADVLARRDVLVFGPASMDGTRFTPRFVGIGQGQALYEGIISTGELPGMEYDLGEHALGIQTSLGQILVVGCSHPGVAEMLAAARHFGPVRAVVGGLHGFADFDVVRGLEVLCPTHCTRYVDELAETLPGAFVRGGAGARITFDEATPTR